MDRQQLIVLVLLGILVIGFTLGGVLYSLG